MKKILLILLGFVLILGLAACDKSCISEYPTNSGESSSKITIKNGPNDYDSINIERIKKFIDNSDKGIDDEIEITQYTIEGDPIITTVRYNAADEIFEIVTDNTQDKFGKPEIIKKEYDNSYKAKLSGEILVEENIERHYYAFQLVNEKDVVDICFFNY